MDFSNVDIIAIVGPTAVGKTDFSLRLAKELNGEIINGDATQIYRDLNIGSAKITVEEMQGIKHHLIDIKAADAEYTVADFQSDCRKIIKDIQMRGKIPIICGGSGLYISAVLYNYNFDIKFKRTESIFNQYSDEEVLAYLHEKFKTLPANLDSKNPVRVRNFLIKNEQSVPMENQGKTPYYDNFKIIGLTCDRKLLHQRIGDRVDQMIANGLIEEVQKFDSCWQSQAAIGYKEIHNYLKGDIDLETAIELIKRNTRRFAKRQYTWFNNKMDVNWYDQKEDKWL